MQHQQTTGLISKIEEAGIALILGLMTLITFANVVLRYGFNTGLIWGLEVVSALFAWLVLLGMSYAVKVNAHLGVDALVNLFNPSIRRILALIAGLVFLAYALLLLKGSWDYWANFAGLPATEGRIIPTGFEESFRSKSWYETEDIPMVWLFLWLEPLINGGDAYEKLPRVVPYVMLPFGVGLLLFRVIQAIIAIAKGTRLALIASHEVEDQIDEARQTATGEKS
ncbi:MAG TPA: TRAP transporter permease DctQ [Alphaproteobacteria bacterium]|nr:TRAP transporter permease DctQ [Alphaproteobacteria bacterium]